MSSFPLYETILQKQKESGIEKLSEVQYDFFLSAIRTVSDKEHELCYALIRKHQLMHDALNSFLLPYNAKTLKKGIRFDFSQLPNDLQVILFTFIELHIKNVG